MTYIPTDSPRQRVAALSADLRALLDQRCPMPRLCDDLLDAIDEMLSGLEQAEVPVRACEQHLRQDEPLTVAATVLAPQVHTCPTPQNPQIPWSFIYVAICDGCQEDWWGFGDDDPDRPECAPPFIALP